MNTEVAAVLNTASGDTSGRARCLQCCSEKIGGQRRKNKEDEIVNLIQIEPINPAVCYAKPKQNLLHCVCGGGFFSSSSSVSTCCLAWIGDTDDDV